MLPIQSFEELPVTVMIVGRNNSNFKVLGFFFFLSCIKYKS